MDDPIQQHLPWFNIRNRDPDTPVITIHHLLTHTSGLPREAPFPYWTGDDFPTSEQIKERLPQQRAHLAPETRWTYSNLAFVLAGEILSAVSAEPYPGYIHRHILKPLGMTNSSVVLPPEHRLRLATGDGRRMPDGTRRLSPFSDLKGLTPAGGMSSTVEDLARFAALQCRDGPASGAQILKGSTLREMHRVHWLDTDWARGWGLGFMLRRQENRALIEHGGSVLGYATWLSISPQEKIAVIVLTNATDGHPSLYGDQALALLAPAITKAGMPTPQIAEPDPAWQTYVGKYRNRWGDLQVLVWNGALVLISPAELDPRRSMATLVPQGEHRFTLTGNDGFMELGATVVFELGPDGRVARMKLGENYMYPVD